MGKGCGGGYLARYYPVSSDRRVSRFLLSRSNDIKALVGGRHATKRMRFVELFGTPRPLRWREGGRGGC
jgi:hypothetical protein